MTTIRNLAVASAIGFCLSYGVTPPASACGATDVCSDLPSSFHGVIILDGIALSWTTDDEDSSIAFYELKRYDCGTPSSCSTSVATIYNTGSCGSKEPYRYVDDPGHGTWAYTLEVWQSNGVRACAVDTTPS